jgi:PPOX class probable F420-dependent enzyme
MVIDPTTDKGATAIARLERDRIGWLTTVTEAGQPETMPIWFLWRDGAILVYGDRRARRNRNLAANPRVSFHLGDDGQGGGIVVVEGTARIDEDLPHLADDPAYLAKYADWMASVGGAEAMSGRYDRRIVITPTRALVSAG